ncbi:hypothetical protein F8388_022783 [Cannabis sativa]|uniref:Uncharacterized protein n=1 Tax=Cannabis sativa TaxID=3483 RepID=A0A7J6F8K2_CANSA|nr:hypothetical protein F8388_022783 [Cannabis sativa]
MGVKGFVEGGIASIIACCSTHPIDLVKVRMQLQGESVTPNPVTVQNLRPAISFHPNSAAGSVRIPTPPPAPPVHVGPITVGVRIVQQEGMAGLFSGVSTTTTSTLPNALVQRVTKDTKTLQYTTEITQRTPAVKANVVLDVGEKKKKKKEEEEEEEEEDEGAVRQ